MAIPYRFAMSPPPDPGADPGKYHEAIVQWFLENTFFRDFVYRNPPEKGGRGELGDAVVLFDDVVVMVQVKAQVSARDPIAWAKKAIRKATKQLSHTNRMLFGGHITELENSLLGKIEFDPDHFESRIGLIVLGQEGAPFLPEQITPEVAKSGFPVHVLSLRDFLLLMERFDTAADLVPYLEFRHDFRERLDRRVHAEELTLSKIADDVGEFLPIVIPGISDEMLGRSVRQFRLAASGAWRKSPDWRFGLAIDDIIAHLHDRDLSLDWNADTSLGELGKITAQLAWLTRDRRIALGKRLIKLSEHACDGEGHFFSIFQRKRGVAYVFLASGSERRERMRFLRYLVDSAHVEFDADAVVGVATDPIGSGRSYDLVYCEGPVSWESREFYQQHGSPFGPSAGQLFP
jgi:hypothetical protein